MRFLLVTIDPVQQIAAEPGTLDALMAAITATATSPLTPLSPLQSFPSWPLVPDTTLPAGFVYLRPHPRPQTTPNSEVIQP
ncbi:MAG TPA: hypothetical protein VFH77_17405 [Streptomyces sp.]|nr:hypothetical protein [Streptomyces sp.]